MLFFDSYKVKKGDIFEIVKSIGIGVIEIVKVFLIFVFGVLFIFIKYILIIKVGYWDGLEGYGYYDEIGLRNCIFDFS